MFTKNISETMLYSAAIAVSKGQTYRVYRPRVTLLTQVVFHFSLQPHAVKVLPHLVVIKTIDEPHQNKQTQTKNS